MFTCGKRHDAGAVLCRLTAAWAQGGRGGRHGGTAGPCRDARTAGDGEGPYRSTAWQQPVVHSGRWEARGTWGRAGGPGVPMHGEGMETGAVCDIRGNSLAPATTPTPPHPTPPSHPPVAISTSARHRSENSSRPLLSSTMSTRTRPPAPAPHSAPAPAAPLAAAASAARRRWTIPSTCLHTASLSSTITRGGSPSSFPLPPCPPGAPAPASQPPAPVCVLRWFRCCSPSPSALTSRLRSALLPHSAICSAASTAVRHVSGPGPTAAAPAAAASFGGEEEDEGGSEEEGEDRSSAASSSSVSSARPTAAAALLAHAAAFCRANGSTPAVAGRRCGGKRPGRGAGSGGCVTGRSPPALPLLRNDLTIARALCSLPP